MHIKPDNNSFSEPETKVKYMLNIFMCIKRSIHHSLMEFIIKNILQTDNVPEILLIGGKLIVIKFMGIKIIDSINFHGLIQNALSMALSKTLGLNELKKRYFRHFFNTPTNQSYIGSYPDQHFYSCHFITIDENSKFIQWHDNQISSVFDLQKELEE